jgi:hypothetical protein
MFKCLLSSGKQGAYISWVGLGNIALEAAQTGAARLYAIPERRDPSRDLWEDTRLLLNKGLGYLIDH